MDSSRKDKIVDTDRLGDGILVTFEDGTTGQFSARLLRLLLTDVKIVNGESETDEEASK